MFLVWKFHDYLVMCATRTCINSSNIGNHSCVVQLGGGEEGSETT